MKNAIGETMLVKIVWGIVLIVLGVALAIGGLSQINEIQALGQIMGGMARNLGGTNAQGFNEAVYSAKIGGAIKIVLGIILAISGSLLVKDAEQKKAESRVDYPDTINTPDPDDWKIK